MGSHLSFRKHRYRYRSISGKNLTNCGDTSDYRFPNDLSLHGARKKQIYLASHFSRCWLRGSKLHGCVETGSDIDMCRTTARHHINRCGLVEWNGVEQWLRMEQFDIDSEIPGAISSSIFSLPHPAQHTDQNIALLSHAKV